MGEATLLRMARTCAPCLLLAAISGWASAQPRYSWELSGLELSSNLTDFDSTAIGATYYFDSVEDGGAPYALAPFFDPTTLVSAAASRLSPDVDTWTVNGRYLLGKSLWYVGAQTTHDVYTRVDDLYTGVDGDRNAYGLVAGKYLGPRTTLELAVDRSQYEYPTTVVSSGICSLPPCPFISATTIAREVTESLSVVHVRQFRSLTYVLEGGLRQFETRLTLKDNGSAPGLNLLQPQAVSLRSYSLGTTLYPTKKLGVHVGYEDTVGSTFGGYTDGTYSVGARWFFRPKVAFELSMSRMSFNDPLAPYGDARTRRLSIVGRF